jgi:large subunit ribosomal protein L23
MKNIYSILIRPIHTEKSLKAQEGTVKKYTFLVDPRANKIEIKQAFETLYAVKVSSIRVVPIRKQVRQLSRTKIMTTRQTGKKAIITLLPGQEIDVMKLGEEKKKKTKAKAKSEIKPVTESKAK